MCSRVFVVSMEGHGGARVGAMARKHVDTGKSSSSHRLLNCVFWDHFLFPCFDSPQFKNNVG